MDPVLAYVQIECGLQVDTRQMIFRGLRVRMAVASGIATEVRVRALQPVSCLAFTYS